METKIQPRLTYQQAINFLFDRINYERRPELASGKDPFSLEKMRRLLDALGNPQKLVPCVHIAGTKGKGSTATMVASILQTAGYDVGLFTSPHVQRLEERFTVNGQLASEVQLIRIVEKLHSVVGEMDQAAVGGPTFFELATAAGWLHFLDQKVDIAVVEVGLGGRLDSTNICTPLACVITSISKDHTRLLGDTTELIAREKAGIIKQKTPVVSGVTEPGPARVIREIASQTDAPLSVLGTDFTIRTAPPTDGFLPPWKFDFSSQGNSFNQLNTSLPGEHQARNAALAVQVSLLLQKEFPQLNEQVIRQGLAATFIPLRIEVMQRSPDVIIDAAHNPASLVALCRTIELGQHNARVCVFAASKDKDCPELLKVLDQAFDKFYLCAYQENPRAIPAEELGSIAASVLSKPMKVLKTPEQAMEAALAESHQRDFICATGSFFLAAELSQWWKAKNSTI